MSLFVMPHAANRHPSSSDQQRSSKTSSLWHSSLIMICLSAFLLSFEVQAHIPPQVPMHHSSEQSPLAHPWFQLSYLFDWGIAIGIGAGGFMISELASPIERAWSPAQTSLHFSIKKESLAWPLTLAFSFGIPAIGMALAQIKVQSGHDFHHAMLGLTESMSLALLLSGTLNLLVGRLRPDWRDRCQPTIESLECTGNEAAIREGRRSFPSKQTTLAFAGGSFLAMYLAGKLKLFDGQGSFWKIPLVLAPLTASLLLGISRINDNRNHWEDIVVGGLLGSACAWLGYQLNFRSHFNFNPHPDQPKRRTKLTWIPIITSEQVGLALTTRW